MTLYELTTEYQQLLELASDPEIDPDVIADTMEGIEGEIEVKADGYAKVMRQLEAESAAIEAEERRLSARRKLLDSNVRRMKDALQAAMIATDKRKFKTELFSFGIQKNPAAVVIDEDNYENIPEEYLIPQAPKVDRAKIKADLKAGKDLSGLAHLEQGESLRIR